MRRFTLIAAVLASLALAGAASANHHEGDEGHGAQSEEGAAPTCEHAADEPCPHHAEGKTCAHHAKGEACDCATGAHHDQEKSEKSPSESDA